jgi:hypothetical protein
MGIGGLLAATDRRYRLALRHKKATADGSHEVVKQGKSALAAE